MNEREEAMSMTRVLWVAICAVVVVATIGSSAVVAQTPVKLEETTAASGSVNQAIGTVGIAGRVFDGYVWGASTFATWRVPGGYAAFEGYCGTNDDMGKEARGTIEFLLDGDTVKSVEVSAGQKAVKVSFPVRGGQSLRINMDREGIVAEPRFTKGIVSSVSHSSSSDGTSQESLSYWLKCPICAKQFDKKSALDEHIRNEHASKLSPSSASSTAAFAIDSNGLDRLADNLHKQCEAKPALKSKMESGQVAIARFSLINIAAKSVSDNVVENLYTAMIKGGFSLVERGQLDKVLDELKVQDSGAVDPATAQKIGKLSGCDIILLGSVSDQGLIVINARMMDTATGKSLVAERVELQKIPIK